MSDLNNIVRFLNNLQSDIDLTKNAPIGDLFIFESSVVFAKQTTDRIFVIDKYLKILELLFERSEITNIMDVSKEPERLKILREEEIKSLKWGLRRVFETGKTFIVKERVQEYLDLMENSPDLVFGGEEYTNCDHKEETRFPTVDEHVANPTDITNLEDFKKRRYLEADM